MPLFLLFINGFRAASTLSFLCICVTSISSMTAYHRAGVIDWKLVKYLGFPLVISMFMSGYVLKTADTDLLKTVLGMALLLGGAFMLLPFDQPQPSLNRAEIPTDRSKYLVRPILLTPVSLIIGFLCGTAGVAGGVFEIPLMIDILGVSPHVAAATSSAILVLASVSGISGRIISNNLRISVNLEMLLVLVCVFLGAQTGPRISLKMDKQVFKRICGIFVLLLGLYYAAKNTVMR